MIFDLQLPQCESLILCVYNSRDIILEAKEIQVVHWACSFCSRAVPHMHCHKVILCSSCDYLRALFQSGMQERLAIYT